jgi:DNA-binding response OmpR family regulator
MVLESIRLTLTCCGFDVVTAASGAEGLIKLAQTTVEMVATDRKMPGMTGEEFATAIKVQWPLLPVLMLTGFPPPQRPAAVDAILLKPFSTAELRATVNRLIQPSAEPNKQLS